MTTEQSGESRYREISRRAFLRRGAALGLTVAIPSSVLAACGGSDAATFDAGPTTSTTALSGATATTAAATTTSTTSTTTTEAPATTAAEASTTTLPDGAELVVDFTYEASASGGRIQNPYVAVWLEDEQGELVATVALWFLQSQKGTKWLSDLRRWATVDGSDSTIDAISSATRVPGTYSVVWDGTDLDGNLVAQGEYFIAIESAREHGPYSLIREPITIGAEAFSQALEPEGELSDATVSLVVA